MNDIKQTFTTPSDSAFRECRNSTRIIYSDNGFFRPRLRSINHLSIGRSRIASSRLTILLESLYRFYIRIRTLISNIWTKLSPKHLNSRIVGNTFDSNLVGRITFAGPLDENTPIHHMKVVFWARTWLFQWRKLSEGISDQKGEFDLSFDLREAKRWSVFKRVFEVYQTTCLYNDSLDRKVVYQLFHSEQIPGSDLIGMRYNLRTLSLCYWEYRSDSAVPRVLIKNHDKDAPQYYSQGRVDAMNEQVIPIELIKLKHLEQIHKNPKMLTMEKIQQDYPTNLTACIEGKEPGSTRSDEWFGRRMMNGMNAATFIPDETEANCFWTRFYGACDYDTNDEYAFPSVQVKFKLNDLGIMMPKEIHLDGRLSAAKTDSKQEHIFKVEDGDKWEQAKRVARVTAALSVELDDHFTGTHLTTEQFAISAYRNLRLNPVAALLFPHLKEVVLVNHSADSILIGPAKPAPPKSPIRAGGIILWIEDMISRALNKAAFEEGGYIPLATAITHEGIDERAKDLLGVQDWKHWKPMEAFSDAHTFPKAQSIYWDMLGDYIDAWFEENEEEVKQHWHEVFCFSRDLVSHSVPVYLSDVNLNELNPRDRKIAEARLEWYQHRYHLNPSTSRDVIDGKTKILSPITHVSEFNEADLDNLKSACRYIIMIATFMHSFVNEHQYDDIGEVLYSCLGLRFGDGEQGIMAPESDMCIAPDLTRSTQMMWFSNLLSRTEYGFIVRNEEGDINPLLVKMLLERREALAQCGVSIDDIESRTNI